MSLPLLIVGGVIVVMTLCIGFSGAEAARVDAIAARAVFDRERPGETIERVVVAGDERAAVVVANGRRHVVFAAGARRAIRPLASARQDGDVWILDFADFSAPAITAAFADADTEVLRA